MKILTTVLSLLAAVSTFAASPVFIGGITNYMTNGPITSDPQISIFAGNSNSLSLNNQGGARHGALGYGAQVNNVVGGIRMQPHTRAQTATATGSSAATVGGVLLSGGDGGDTSIPTTGTGGAGGPLTLVSGSGGSAVSATTNATGGAGGALTLSSGGGGTPANSVATNAATGGNGGTANLSSGDGGVPSAPATNTVSGNGGTFNILAGSSASPSAGWARKTGNGGALNIAGGGSGDTVRTNSGNGGSVTISGGASGDVTTSPGNPGAAGFVELRGGKGGGGGTNANGGPVYISGGTGAITGPIVLGVLSDGTVRGGGVGVNTNRPQAAVHVVGDIAMTGAAQPVHLATTATNNILQTNWLGTVNVAAASVIEAAFNLFGEINQTNRMTAAQTITLTNGTEGYRRMRGVIPGEAAGGASRNAVFVAHTGQLIIDLDDSTAVPAVSKTVAIPAGNVLEWDVELKPFGFTNFLFFVSRQAKF